MDILQVLEGLAYVGFIAGAVFAVIELRDLKKDRRLGLMMQACMHGTTMEFENAMSKVWRTDARNAEELEKQVSYAELSMLADFLVSIAHFGFEGLIDKRTLTGFFPFSHLWNKMKPWVMAERAAAGMPKLYYEWELLGKMQEEEGSYSAATARSS